MCRNSNIPVSGTMLKEEATIIAEKLGITGFAASNGWLESFKRQHNIGNMKVSGEAGGVRQDTVESWSEKKSRKMILLTAKNCKTSRC